MSDDRIFHGKGMTVHVAFRLPGLETLDDAMRALGLMSPEGIVTDRRVSFYSGIRYDISGPIPTMLREPAPDVGMSADYVITDDEPEPGHGYWSAGDA